MVEAVIAAGATTINIPDTTGYCTPYEYGEKIKYLKNNVKNIDKAILSAHCHNDLGMATANALAGVMNGVRQVECTINGIGERAGNTSMEEIVMIVKCHHDMPVYTDIDTKRFMKLSRMVSNLMRMPRAAEQGHRRSQRLCAFLGAFIRTACSSIAKTMKSSIRLTWGVTDSSIVLTARSGRAALDHHLKRLGYNLKGDDLDAAYTKFLIVADAQKSVSDDDLRALAGTADEVNTNRIRVDHLQVLCGKSTIPMATVRLIIDGEPHTATAAGNGPIDASLNAVRQILKQQVNLEEFLIQAFNRGTDDVGKVHNPDRASG